MRTRRAPVCVAVCALLLPLGSFAAVEVGPATLRDLAAAYAHRFPLDPPPSGQTPQSRARWLVEERSARGRSPAAWIEGAKGLATAKPARGGTPADLVAEILRLHAALGAPALPASAVTAAAVGIPAFARAPFGSLVGAVADAAEAQAPVARAVAARIARGLSPEAWLTAGERDAIEKRRQRIVAEIDRFHARTRGGFAALARDRSSGILFADPLRLVVLGGTGDDTYERTPEPFPDPALLVDPEGNDTYRVAAGGACPLIDGLVARATLGISCNNLVIAVHADLGEGAETSADAYLYDGLPSVVQGSGGFGALGILVDVAGNDRYVATMTRDGVPPLNSYVDAGAQGYGLAGLGVLVDRDGDDEYRFDVRSLQGHSIWAFAQGFGAGGGLGIALDARGNDRWLANGLGLVGEGFQGLYTTGVGFWAGVGVFADLGAGEDVYRGEVRAQNVDLYSYGFGALGGLGILYDDGGDDEYYSYEESTGPKPSWIDPLLNCAYGTGSIGGVGIMIDGAGDDVYYGETVSLKGATVMDWGFGGPGQAYGLFVDHAGDDVYAMYASGTKEMVSGRGHWDPHAGGEIGIGEERYGIGENTWGTFVDHGGEDSYIGGYGANDEVWVFGADVS